MVISAVRPERRAARERVPRKSLPAEGCKCREEQRTFNGQSGYAL